jgi:hypothetical protein
VKVDRPISPIYAGSPMTTSRKIALAAGVFFLITFVSSIVGLLLYDPVLNDSGYVIGSGSDAQISMGAFCELVLCVANIGSAVVLFPILKFQNEGLALGYVVSRTVESMIILLGIVSLLSIVTLRQDFAGTDGASFVIAGKSLVAIHDWTFLLGPAYLAGLGNGVMLGYLMYKSELMPRKLALFGLIGGPLLIVAATLVLFGAFDQQSGISFLMTLPEIIWELSIGIYLTFKGFRSSPILTAYEQSLVEKLARG